MTVRLAGGEGTALLVIDLQVGMLNGERIVPVHMGERLLARVRGESCLAEVTLVSAL